MVQPEQITNRRAAGVLEVQWDDGATQALTHLHLRQACKCSPCQAARLRGQAPDAPADVRLDEIRQIGHYAVQLVFSDGHERGIYPWELLRSLG
jgi:DUF971 family protein